MIYGLSGSNVKTETVKACSVRVTSGLKCSLSPQSATFSKATSIPPSTLSARTVAPRVEVLSGMFWFSLT